MLASVSTFWDYVLVFGAAVAGGVVNAVAGGGSVITFPTLLFLGMQPIRANATNTVALWPGQVAGAVGFRSELADSRRVLSILAIPAVVGGTAGALILLATPVDVFRVIAPFLVLTASLLMAVREPLGRRLRGSREEERVDGAPRSGRWWAGAVGVQLAISVYGGFFGAGMGILLLAALSLLGMRDLHRMNGIKNVVSACTNGAALVYFTVFGAVAWPVAGVMAVGAIAGGLGGARLAYRLGQQRVRRTVVAIGVVMTVALLIRLCV